MKNRCHGLHNFPNLDEEIAVQVRFGIRTNAGGKGFEGEGVCNSVLDQRIPNPSTGGDGMMEGSGCP